MRYLLLLASLLLLACGNPGGDPCEPPPDDWPSPEFTAEEFATSWDSPPLREGLYNLGGRRLVIPEGAWVDSGRGPSVSCLEGERCPSDGGILSLHGANLPEMGEERARIVFWLFDEGPTSWNLWIEGDLVAASDDPSGLDCNCPGDAKADIAAMTTIACYLRDQGGE